MSLTILLVCVAALLATGFLAIFVGRAPRGYRAIYAISLAASLGGLGAALGHLLADSQPAAIDLPLGLPWLGAQFRIDALSAFFLAVIDLGAAAASLFALGYGHHEEAPQRVLPFYVAFLAAMNLVVLADDAFTFLVSWEFMSLTSWALVVAHHRVRSNLHAGYVYLIMAGFGTLTLLLTFGLLTGQDGGYTFEQIRATPCIRGNRRRGADTRAGGCRIESGPGPPACMAAARTPRSTQPCVGPDERGDD